MQAFPYKKKIPIPLTEDEVRQKTLEHIATLEKIDQLKDEKKKVTKDIADEIKVLEKQTKDLAKTVVDKIEKREVDVWDVADYELKKVVTLRRGKDGAEVVVESRGMTHEEQQQALFKSPSPEAAEDMAANVVEVPKVRTSFEVELVNAGDEPIKVVKVLKELTGLGLGPARSLVAASPRVVKSTKDKAEAEKWITELEKVGAEVVLHEPAESAVEVDAAVAKAEAILEGKALPPAGVVNKTKESSEKGEEVVEAPKEDPGALAEKFRIGMGAPSAPKERRSR